MATLAAGDTTTQLVLYIKTNAAGSDVHPKLKAALVTELTANAAIELQSLLKRFIAR